MSDIDNNKGVEISRDNFACIQSCEEQRMLLGKHLIRAKEVFLYKIAKGRLQDVSYIQSQAKRLCIPFYNQHYVVIVVSPVRDPDSVLCDVALSVLEEKIRNEKSAADHLLSCCTDANGQLLCVITVDAPYADSEKIEKVLSSLIDTVENETGIQFNYGIGAFVNKPELLNESYELAMSVLEFADALQNDHHPGTVNAYLKEGADIHNYLLDLFRAGDIDSINNTVQLYLEKIRLNAPGRQVLIERFAVLYLQNITNECMRLGITLERFESYVPAVVCLMQLDGLGSIENMLRLTEQILKHISVHKTKEGNHLLSMAKDYIRDNLGNDKLDLATVGDYVGLSRVYFCKLFHQMEGISFSAYLKKVRIEKAKQLLLTTNMKVFEVSNAVGFSHAKYFGQVFKDVVGQTPVEFQKGIRKDV